jgi:hypothetical protein
MQNNSQAQSAQAQTVDLSGFARARATIMEMRSRGVVCAIWGMASGFVKSMRSPETLELLQHDSLAFALLAIIAHRARWRSGFSADGLEIGEALIGDYKNYGGMTRWEYRERVARLVKWGFITARPTPKGTIAKLTSTSVFDLCLTNQQTAKTPPTVLPNDTKKPPTVLPMKNNAEPPTNRQQTANKPPLTKNDKKETKKDMISHATAEAEGNSTSAAESNSAKVSVSLPLWVLKEKKKYPRAQDHPKWQEFADWCSTKRNYHGRPGRPIAKGFWTWLSNQPEPWRDRVKTRKDELSQMSWSKLKRLRDDSVEELNRLYQPVKDIRRLHLFSKEKQADIKRRYEDYLPRRDELRGLIREIDQVLKERQKAKP